MNSFYSEEELKKLGFESIGKNVSISRKASFYGTDRIKIGNNVRIDDFALLSGMIEIGNNVHIAAYTALYGGKAGIKLGDYVGISSRCAVYAESDDYMGHAMSNPTVPSKYRKTYGEQVRMERHVLIGSGTTVLPGSVIAEGSAVGSMSFVNKSLDEWGIYVGIPCKYIKERSKDILRLAEEYEHESI